MRVPALIFASMLASCQTEAPPQVPSVAQVPPAEQVPPVETVDLNALPGDSLYHLTPDLIDQHGQQTALSVFAGHPVLISMFYASCPSACPMLIADVQALEAELTEAERANSRVLLISLDPEADDPAALAEVVERYGLDDARWRLTSPRPEQVRDIAAALGISYQAVADGEFHHASIVTLLDPKGSPIAHVEGLRQSPAPLLTALRAL